MIIKGNCYHLGSSERFEAQLEIVGLRYTLKTQADEVCRLGDISEISVSDKLGNVERRLSFNDGAIFTTQYNHSIDNLFRDRTKLNRLIHAIESNTTWVVVALVITISTSFSFFKWGIPWVSHSIAHALPQKTGDIIGSNTLELLDDFVLEPSTIDETTQEELRQHFQNELVERITNHETIKYKLHFRAWGSGEHSIANALALPSGDIILTDKFVEISESQDEIDSVLLHEIGHIEHKHTLQMLSQSTIVTTAVTLATGDTSAAADMGIGLGTLLLNTSYSRNFESEADEYAFKKMLELKIDPQSFAAIMQKITESPKLEDLDELPDGNNKTKDYLSSHPSTKKRIQKAKRYAQCYKKGLIICDSLSIKR